MTESERITWQVKRATDPYGDIVNEKIVSARWVRGIVLAFPRYVAICDYEGWNESHEVVS